MLRHLLLSSLLLVPTVTFAQISHAEESAEFSDLFGSQLERVKNTRDKADDLKLASDFLKYLDFEGVNLEMKLLLVDHAYDLAMSNPEGHPIAEQALRTKLNLAPAKSIEIRSKLYALINTQLRSRNTKDRNEIYPLLLEEGMALAKAYEHNAQADKAADQYRLLLSIARQVSPEAHQHVLEQRKRLISKISAQKELESIKKELLSTPTEALALKAAEILLIVFDQPKEAEPYAQVSGNEEWQKHVPLANSKDFSKVSDADLLSLGVWYKKLADSAEASNQAALYARAVKYLAMAKDREAMGDVMRLTAQVKHRDALEQLEKLGGSGDQVASRTGGSSATLKNAKDQMPIMRRLIQGKKMQRVWQVRGENIVRMAGKFRHIGLREAKIKQEFAVSFNLELTSPSAGFHLRLPVHKEHDMDLVFRANIENTLQKNGKVISRDIIGVGKPGNKLKITVRCKKQKDSAAYVIFINNKKVKEHQVKYSELLKEKQVPFLSFGPLDNKSTFIFGNVKTTGVE